MAPHQDKVTLKHKVTLRKKQNSATPTPSDQAPKSSRRKVWILVIVIVALIGGGYLLFNNRDAQPTESTELVAATEVSPSDSPAGEQASSLDADGDAAPELPDAPQSTEAQQDSEAPASAAVASEPAEGQTEKQTASTESKPAQDASIATIAEPRASASATVDPNKSIDEVALDVIRGLYGNGTTRKANLGSRYAEIQKRVNEMYQSLPR
ncbi:MAG: hypothetical protein PUI89_02460 [Bacteroidales bacterium]|uniref:hypothetical protein n=1 Tax=Porphyromonas sp. TaxID=1924944 RepID=UPI002A81FD79|nr:hypothetical protein [Porphyromonas sp.]MDD6928142.1 hypothetical protein [Bacteroidales bacterium]MDY4244876.1 hypothetical protein [Porphyromonas sp.]